MGERGQNQRVAARTKKMRAHNHRLIRVFTFIICMALALAAGFLLRGQSAFLQTLGFPSSITGIDPNAAADTGGSKDIYNSLAARVGEMESVLADNSLDTYDLDDATTKTLSAFAEATDDPNARYYTPERYSALLNSSDESYAGIGVLFSEYNGSAYVVDVFEGSQAQLEGVQEGDFVVAINGDNSQGWTRSEVTSVLSQAKGSTVVITWRRPKTLESSGGVTFTTNLECKDYEQVNVTYDFDEERSVGYIRVRQLTQNAAPLVGDAIGQLTNAGARAFVLDIRDNPGGYLNQAVDLASLFMRGGTVVEVQTVDGYGAKATTGEPATGLPLVLLINKNTSSAAEVVAAALKESQRATLVGQTTMGRGTVQVNYELKFGGAIRYTAARYLTPDGHGINGVGVSPEVAIDADGDGDNQREYALSLASSLSLE